MASLNQFREWLRPYSGNFDDATLAKLMTYFDLLQKWNQRMALTSLTDEQEIVEVLFGESAAACPLIAPEYGRLADVGAGAGFPGLVIKILRPAMEVFLIEPNLRKSVFLREVSRALKLDGVSIIQGRVGVNAQKMEIPKLNWITSRALSGRQGILNFSFVALNENGKVLLWTGPNGLKEVQADKNWVWSNPMLLVGTKGRFIAVGQRKT